MSGNQGAPGRREAPSRARALWQLLSLVVLGCAVTASAEAPADPPEKARVVVGLGGSSKSYLPLYLAGERTCGRRAEPRRRLRRRVQGRDGARGGLRRHRPGLPRHSGLRVHRRRTAAAGLLRGVQPRGPRVVRGAGRHERGSDLRGTDSRACPPVRLPDGLPHPARPAEARPRIGRRSTSCRPARPSTRWQALRAGTGGRGRPPASPCTWQARPRDSPASARRLSRSAPEWPTNVMFTRTDVLSTRDAVSGRLPPRPRAGAPPRTADRGGRDHRPRKLAQVGAGRRRSGPTTRRSAGFDERGRLPGPDRCPSSGRSPCGGRGRRTPRPDSRILDRRFIDSFENLGAAVAGIGGRRPLTRAPAEAARCPGVISIGDVRSAGARLLRPDCRASCVIPSALPESRATVRQRLARARPRLPRTSSGTPCTPITGAPTAAARSGRDAPTATSSPTGRARGRGGGRWTPLLREGVYLTVDELKGRRPVVRGGAHAATSTLAGIRNPLGCAATCPCAAVATGTRRRR